ncbi:hypothetical protein GCM10011506_30380 [Marivirga lumbricoides]|uniref:Glycosyltransferase 2-like domain-containing protein n=1 Tax=Marivirga lumbricoides TaxID=1046115 RepID=A0ABQ1MMB1_9BACT|nr:hypothetical protein GCM10011506_30380 [Marivirga lumbricoides]
MEVTVIIPTFNRAGQVINLLKSLEKQTFKEFEVVLINDGSGDNTLETLNEYNQTTNLQLTIIDSINKGRAVSRNLGVKQAKGKILIFFDDDVRANPDCIKSHVNFHREKTNSVLSGPCLYDKSKLTTDFHFFRKKLEENWYSPKKEAQLSKSLRLNGGNFSINKDLFLASNGFDERLKDKEDFFLSFNLYQKHQVKIYSLNTAWVYHDDFKNLHQYIKRGIESRKEEQKLAVFEPDIQLLQPERFKFLPRNKFKSIIFKFFKIPSVIQFFSNSIIIFLLPKTVRYKIYDIIVTANITYINL